MTSPRNRTMQPFSKPTAMKLRFSWTDRHVTCQHVSQETAVRQWGTYTQRWAGSIRGLGLFRLGWVKFFWLVSWVLGHLIRSENSIYAFYRPLGYMATPDEGDLAPTTSTRHLQLTGRDTDELLELVQHTDVWWELVVEWWSNLQPPD